MLKRTILFVILICYCYSENLSAELHNMALSPRMGGRPDAINFTLADTNGKTVSLSDFRGKFVIVSMFADWCRPCLNEVAPTREMQTYFLSSDIVWIFISFDRDRESWLESIHKDKLKGIQLWGKPDSDKLKKLFNFNSLPYYIWIDKDGSVAMDDAPRPSSKSSEKELKLYLK